MRSRKAYTAAIIVAALVVAVILIRVLTEGRPSEDQDKVESGDHVIVSIGDSVAAGEGNPIDGEWLRPATACHRSEHSGHRIAWETVSAEQPDLELEFRSYACTGATIREGLTGAQKPGHFGRQGPQLEHFAEFAEADIEAVILSVGANDVGFSRIVRFCAGPGPDCSYSRDYGPAKDWAKRNGKPTPTLREYVRMLIDGLLPQYRSVNAGIPKEIDRSRILIVEYFDPTRSPKDEFCAVFRGDIANEPKKGLIKPEESEWARKGVLVELNKVIANAARELHWRYVDGVDEAFNGHGICATDPQERWVRTLKESIRMQGGHKGTLHPDEQGQEAIGLQIVPVLTDALTQ